MMGVASGLAVDEWRDGRRDALEERRYLDGLRADLAADTVAYGRSSELAGARGVAISSGLDRLDGPAMSPEEVPVVLDDLSFALNQNYPTPRTDTYEQLLAQGGLGQIGSPALRAELTAYYADVARRQVLYDGWEEWRRALEIRAMEVLPTKGYDYMVSNGRSNPSSQPIREERVRSASEQDFGRTLAAIQSDDMIRSLFVRSRVTHGRLSGTTRNQLERAKRLLTSVEAELLRLDG
jgi:hypothetical protein